MSDLHAAGLFFNHNFIPANEIHLKIGGDHGGGTFKMSFQVGNVEHPNKPSNTVIFSHMEAKDYKSNLVLGLERFKLHISQFSKVNWEGRIFRLFLFGDYEFLCNMFGLSGARGCHPCLWCNITSDMLCVPRLTRNEHTPATKLGISQVQFECFSK